MAGNATFESASASSCKLGFSESYLNGRGVRSTAVATVGSNLDKLGNFREDFESRVFGSGSAVARGGSGALVACDGSRTLLQSISLEPIGVPEEITWCDELRRVLGDGDNSLRGAAGHVRPLTSVTVVKDIKRLRLSVEDTCFKARVRANKMNERLRKLDKYCEGVTSKKQKMIYSINQRVADRPKNILLNKRVRTSVAESRAKDGNLLEDNGGESDLFEKIRRLAAGGEGWDKKVKRKRSVGTFFSRPVESDEVPKRALQNKVADAHCRLSNRDDLLSNRKLPMPPPGSSSPPMTQWVGQKPQKIARSRRPNLVPLVSNQNENRLSFDNHSPSDVGAKLTSKQANGSPISKVATNSPQKLMEKIENFQSPLSESQESFGSQSRLIGKEFGNGEIDTILKNKPVSNAATTKAFQSNKTGHKKNGSTPVRRLKKLSDRKVLSRHSSSQNNSSPDCTGASDDDRGELLAAANYARIAPHLACSSPLWKKMEPVFAPVSSEDKSFLSQEVGFLHEDSVSNHMQNQENRSFSEEHDVDETASGSIPMYQRLLSALIDEDNIDNLEEDDAGDTYNFNSFVPTNSGTNSFKNFMINNIHEDVYSEVNMSNGISDDFLNGPQRYEDMCVDDDKVLQELHSIGIYPDIMVGSTTPVSGISVKKPPLHDEENEPIQQEIEKLKTQLHQQEVKKKAYLEKICQQVEGDTEPRDLQTIAMDRLVELSCKKLQQANKRNPRSGTHKVPNQSSLAFGKRTLARCHKFENSGVSCFNEPPYQDILYAPVKNDTKLLSDETFAVKAPLSNKGRKKEILLNDVGTSRSRKPKSKPKPKQSTSQIPTTSANGSTRSTHPTGPTWPTAYRRDVRAVSQDPANPPLNDLDPLDELGVGGPQDLNSFLNFDEQDPEFDYAGGLDVPMDDLTELF